MTSPIRRLRSFARLPRRERRLLPQAWALSLFADLVLRTLPFPRVLGLGDQVFARRGASEATPDIPVARLRWLVEVAGRYAPSRSTCLTQALVLSWLLARRGIRVSVRIGVARRDGRFAAHAWLETDGPPITGLPDGAGYEPLLSDDVVRALTAGATR